jgi:cystathionine gamma-lyase
MHFNTSCVHAGVEPEPVTGAIMTPIFQTSTYMQSEIGVHKGYDYSRTDNPTRTALQKALAELEGERFALCFSSGMAATDALVSTLKSGEHFLSCNDVYGGTYRLLKKVREQQGILSDFVSFSNLEEVEKQIRPETRWIWIESPTNPLLQIIDIRGVVELAHRKNVRVAVDNTFMTPHFQRPLELGADLVMHSVTKYLNGHSDVVMGCLITGDQALYDELKFIQNAGGGVPSPFDCFLVLRGLKTLAVRMQRHQENALEVARFLSSRNEVSWVRYPGLKSHPQHELHRRQATGFGGMVSFELQGGLDAARLRQIRHTVRLGRVSGRRGIPVRSSRYHDARFRSRRAARTPRHCWRPHPPFGRNRKRGGFDLRLGSRTFRNKRIAELVPHRLPFPSCHHLSLL